MKVLFAFTLTLIAGLSTGIGSIIAFFAKKTNVILPIWGTPRKKTAWYNVGNGRRAFFTAAFII